MLKKFNLYAMPFVWILLIILSGCSAGSSLQPSPNDTVKGAAIGTAGGAILGTATGVGTAAGAVVGGVSGAVIGSYLEKQKNLVQKIADNHVQVIMVGDNLRLILPADRFFVPNTPILNTNYYTVLNQIALLLRGLDKYVVKIAGYTDNVGWSDRNLALSRQQAQTIANYLWKQGIDARVLFATGYGAKDPIASNATAQGRAKNRRIEIIWRAIMDDRDQ